MEVNLWNTKFLPAPATNTYRVIDNSIDIKLFSIILQEGSNFFGKERYLRAESALLSKCVYKMKNKFRMNKDFKEIQKLSKALENYVDLDMSNVMRNLMNMLPERYEPDETYLPTKNMLDYVLVRLQGLGKLMVRIVETSKSAGLLYLQRLRLGHFWRIGFIIFALISRIYVLAKYIVKFTCMYYSKLVLFSPKLQNTTPWLPENFVFPKDLQDWLGVDWIDIEQEIIEIPEEIPQIMQFFDLTESDDDIEICDDTVSIDDDDDVEVVSEYKNMFHYKLANVVNEISRYTNRLRGFDDDIDIGEVIEINDESMMGNSENLSIVELNSENITNDNSSSVVEIEDINTLSSDSEGDDEHSSTLTFTHLQSNQTVDENLRENNESSNVVEVEDITISKSSENEVEQHPVTSNVGDSNISLDPNTNNNCSIITVSSTFSDSLSNNNWSFENFEKVWNTNNVVNIEKGDVLNISDASTMQWNDSFSIDEGIPIEKNCDLTGDDGSNRGIKRKSDQVIEVIDLSDTVTQEHNSAKKRKLFKHQNQNENLVKNSKKGKNKNRSTIHEKTTENTKNLRMQIQNGVNSKKNNKKRKKGNAQNSNCQPHLNIFDMKTPLLHAKNNTPQHPINIKIKKFSFGKSYLATSTPINPGLKNCNNNTSLTNYSSGNTQINNKIKKKQMLHNGNNSDISFNISNINSSGVNILEKSTASYTDTVVNGGSNSNSKAKKRQKKVKNKLANRNPKVSSTTQNLNKENNFGRTVNVRSTNSVQNVSISNSNTQNLNSGTNTTKSPKKKSKLKRKKNVNTAVASVSGNSNAGPSLKTLNLKKKKLKKKKNISNVKEQKSLNISAQKVKIENIKKEKSSPTSDTLILVQSGASPKKKKGKKK